MGAAAQEADLEVDSLFEQPAADIVVDSAASQAVDNLKALNKSDTITVSGCFKTAGGAAFGWTEYPEPADIGAHWDMTPLANASATLSIDARPDPDVRVFGTFGFYVVPSSGSFTWSQITVDELFCDYTLLGTAFLRLGKHTVSWGQGRLYVPGNLMSDSANGTTLRVSFPTVLSGISFLVLAQDSFFLNVSAPSYAELAYGTMADAVLADTRVSLGVRYRSGGPAPEGARIVLSVKRTLLGTDFLCDVVYRDRFGTPDWSVLGGFYREWEKIKVYGEYQYDGDPNRIREQYIGLALGVSDLLGSGVDLGLKWLHTVSSGSGGLALGLTFTPAKYITATFAIPYIYGENGRYDILNDTNVTTESYTLTQKLSLVVLCKLQIPF